MVAKGTDPGTVREYSTGPSRMPTGRLNVTMYFDQGLYKQIKAEADRRGWSFSRMVRHLCEASIEGIE